jgi:hypothetical protein
MSSGRRLLYALALVLVALVSYSVVAAVTGRGGSGSDQTAPRRSLPRSAAAARFAQATPAREADDSPQGAASAAALYLQVLDDASSSRAISRQLRALSLPPLTAKAVRVEAASAALKAKLSDQGPSFVQGWRLGWRVFSFNPRVARIAVWAMGMVQGPREVLAPDYSTTLCTLRWTGGRWRVFAAATNPGPVPPIDGSNHSAVALFVREANRFRPLTDAP